MKNYMSVDVVSCGLYAMALFMADAHWWLYVGALVFGAAQRYVGRQMMLEECKKEYEDAMH